MSLKQKILLILTALVLFNLLLLIVFGDKGLVDLYHRKSDLHQIQKTNEDLTRQNLETAREIDRLEHDDEYIEHVARDQLGVVRKDEIILKVPEEATTNRN